MTLPPSMDGMVVPSSKENRHPTQAAGISGGHLNQGVGDGGGRSFSRDVLGTTRCVCRGMVVVACVWMVPRRSLVQQMQQT